MIFNKREENNYLVAIMNEMADYILYHDNCFISRDDVVKYFYLKYITDKEHLD